jgi:DNA-binding NarL/FixJ family response regulator
VVELTRKEWEVMELLMQGKRDREIGALLGVASRTVTCRISNVCDKLRAETRAQAVAIYMRNTFEDAD